MATAVEQRKAELMNRPGTQSGDYAFSRAMEALSLYSEFEQLPQHMQSPDALQRLAAMPHDAGCLRPVFLQIRGRNCRGRGDALGIAGLFRHP